MLFSRHLSVGGLFAGVLKCIASSLRTKNGAYHSTLLEFLLFLSGLLGDPIFAEEIRLVCEGTDTSLDEESVDFGDRELRLSTLRLKQLLRLSGGDNLLEDLIIRLDVSLAVHLQIFIIKKKHFNTN